MRERIPNVARGPKQEKARKPRVLRFSIAGSFSACGCQKKSLVHETECRHGQFRER